MAVENEFGLYLFNHYSGKWSFQVPRNPNKYGKEIKTFIVDNLNETDAYYNYAHYDFKDLVDEFLKLCGLRPTSNGVFYKFWQSNVANNDICLVERATNKIYYYKDANRDDITERSIYEFFNIPYDTPSTKPVLLYNTQVIALCGDIGAGKDTTAKYLVKALEACGKTVRVMAFADSVKDVVAAAHSVFIDRNKLQGIEEEDRKWRTQEIPELSEQYGRTITPRILMQIFGDLYRDHINPDFWINEVKNKVLQARKDIIDYVIITDCRFKNEIEFVLNELHAYLIEIQRNTGSEWIEEYLRTGIKPDNKHESDVNWIKFVRNLTETDRKFIFQNETNNFLKLEEEVDHFVSDKLL